MKRPVDTINGQFIVAKQNGRIDEIFYPAPAQILQIESFSAISRCHLFPNPLNLKPLPEGLF